MLNFYAEQTCSEPINPNNQVTQGLSFKSHPKELLEVGTEPTTPHLMVK